MKKPSVLLAVILFAFLVSLVYAQQYGQRTGGANVTVPKGTKLIKKDGATFVENLRDYTSRKFTEVEGRVKNLETDNANLKKSVEDLKSAVASLQKQLAALTQKASSKDQTGATGTQSTGSDNGPADQSGATSQQ